MDGRILINPVNNNNQTNTIAPAPVDPLSNPLSPSGKIEESGDVKGARECQTCKNRKYQDGSNEMVSFKSASHVSPTAAGSAVRAHEMEHVSNAFSKAKQGNGKVIQASVTLKTAICPECGRSYVSGGVTNTKIKYSNEEQPYQKQLKAILDDAGKGDNIDVNG